MRATPPAARDLTGTLSNAITATAPASSAILACSGVVTSMMTPPLMISPPLALSKLFGLPTQQFFLASALLPLIITGRNGRRHKDRKAPKRRFLSA